MSKRRYTASSIDDDALDALYENANEGWRRGDRWKERAESAEAALRQVLATAEVIEANGLKWAADSVRRAATIEGISTS
ncbi:hypothetical protein AB0I66_24525 [Streptomyces sp. NPDC050439]|uniref:hypothetical protein n=1 Tax=unclassified Streptomyces TaxID=2593676 RepID=UPI00342A1826